MLKDRNYCSWLIEQDWFLKNYEYLHNRLKEYCPKKLFVPEIKIDSSRLLFANLKDLCIFPLPFFFLI